jgi:hypothetical protein
MMRKVLMKLEKEVRELVQRNNLFRTACKTRDRVCKVIIESGSIDNLVSTEDGGKAEVGDNCTSKSVQGIMVAERTSSHGKSTM